MVGNQRIDLLYNISSILPNSTSRWVFFNFTKQGVIDDEDEEPKEEEPPENRIEVEIPRIVTDLGQAVHYVKLPNFLSVETR